MIVSPASHDQHLLLAETSVIKPSPRVIDANPAL
jgi:hypothetical protein